MSNLFAYQSRSAILPFQNFTQLNLHATKVVSSENYQLTAVSKVQPHGHHDSVDCVVVGGGITGLCVARSLVTKHRHADLKVIATEAKDRVGGMITTVEKDGHLWEEGPNSFNPSQSMLSLAVDNGLNDDLVFGDPNAPRFIFWDGRLRRVPSKLSELPFFDLMSFNGTFRACMGALGFRLASPGYEESIEEFVRRNLGDEAFERLVEPFCSGVYAGDPSKLSMKAAFGKFWKLEQSGGCIIGGVLKAFRRESRTLKPVVDPRFPKLKGQTVVSFKNGLAMLPNAIACSLGSIVKLCWKLLNIIKLEDGRYMLTYDTPDGLVSLLSRSVVFAVPSHVANSLLHPLSAIAADYLSKINYPPVAVVSLSYPEGAIQAACLIEDKLKGFGQLHPRSQGVETLGTIYCSSLFPNRAPAGRILLSSFIGGATNPDILSKCASELVETVDSDLKKMLINPKAEDPLVLGVKLLPQAIPQCEIGHLDTIDSIKCALRDSGLRGLFLGGNYMHGVALGHCVKGAHAMADQVAHFLSLQHT